MSFQPVQQAEQQIANSRQQLADWLREEVGPEAFALQKSLLRNPESALYLIRGITKDGKNNLYLSLEAGGEITELSLPDGMAAAIFGVAGEYGQNSF